MKPINTKEIKDKFKKRIDEICKQLQFPQGENAPIRNEIIKFLDSHKIDFETVDDKKIYVLIILIINPVMEFIKFNMTLEGIIALLKLEKPKKLITNLNDMPEEKPEVVEIFGQTIEGMVNKKLMVLGQKKDKTMLVILNSKIAEKTIADVPRKKISEM